MEALNNPFVIYGYKGAKYFCDREQETETIIKGLSNERNIALIAPRRIGKTGLIHHVFSKIRTQQPDVCCIYFDVMATKTLEQFVQLMAHHVLGRLDSPTQAAFKKIQDFFSAFRPTMTFDGTTGMPTFSLDIAKNEEEQSLRRIFEYLSMSNKRCYIAIDEFQQISQYAEADTEALLRSFIQFVPNVYFIFSGSQRHMMSDIFLSPERPLYQGAQIVTIHEINETKYHLFANALFQERGQRLPEEVFHHLYNKVDGQTWYIQAILNRVYSNKTDDVIVQDIDDAIQELVHENAVVFENYYASLTLNQATLLTAIAHEQRIASPMAASFIAKYQLPALSSIKVALKKLTDNQLVYHQNGNYIIYDRFFAWWLRENTGTLR